MWYMPLDWVNYVDQKLFTKEYTQVFRYITMLYHSLLNLGSNEFGPVNEIEMIYLVITLIMSALLNALIFGDVANLISVLTKNTQEYQ